MMYKDLSDAVKVNASANRRRIYCSGRAERALASKSSHGAIYPHNRSIYLGGCSKGSSDFTRATYGLSMLHDYAQSIFGKSSLDFLSLLTELLQRTDARNEGVLF
jgi:transcription initiation factor TFIID subunit TAF12